MAFVHFGLRMTEILNIILQLIIFLFYFSTPLNIFNKDIIFKNKSINFYDCLGFNIFIHLNFLLIYSFFNLNSQTYFLIVLIINVFINSFYIKKVFSFKFEIKDIYIFIIFLLITISIFFDISANLRLEWDALSHWIFKARNFFDGEPIQNLKDLEFSEYPHLGTFVWGFFWKNSLLELEYFGRLFYVFFYVISLFSIHKFIFNKNIFKLFLSLLLILLITYDTFMFSGYQEYLIFSTMVFISRFFLVFRTSITNLLILIFISHLLIWFKDEGLFYFIIFTSIIILYSKENYINKILCLIIMLLLPFIQFYLQTNVIGTYSFQSQIFHSGLSDLLNLKIFLSKSILIFQYMIISIIKYNLIIIYLLSLIFLFLFSKNQLNLLKLFSLIFVLNYGLFFAIYLHTPYDMEFLLRVTLDRLIFQTSGIYLLIVLISFKKITRNMKTKL